MVKIRVQVVIEYEDESSETIVEEICCLQRDKPSLETLGLTLAEGKEILAQLQKEIITYQVADYIDNIAAALIVTSLIGVMVSKPSPIALYSVS
jgi:hypothetical protein